MFALNLTGLGFALSTATGAIEEMDSIHGRSWIVRAEAQRAPGRIDAAAAG
jgi:hypothetical protein